MAPRPQPCLHLGELGEAGHAISCCREPGREAMFLFLGAASPDYGLDYRSTATRVT
jgi:hypothetical protein